MGCRAPRARLSFPAEPVKRLSGETWYDVKGRGRADFGLLSDDRARVDRVAYDDDGDGSADRIYRLDEYANEDVPHLIILLDSIPYQGMADRYAAGDFRFLGPPQKVIPNFPTLTECAFTHAFHGPPLPGVIDQYYDRRTDTKENKLWDRVLRGYKQPWERRLHYRAEFWQFGMSFLKPRPWFAGELERARKAFDDSPDRVTLVYLGTTASMLCKYGRRGMDLTLDGVHRLCLQALYERQGAVKISIASDHGHNLVPSKNVSLEEPLRAAGFKVAERLDVRHPRDVFLEVNGLVTYAAVRTLKAAEAAAAVVRRPEVEFAMYKEGERVVVRDGRGAAAVECRNRLVRYVPIDRDVLGYGPVTEAMRAEGRMSADGFARDEDWFAATVDHEYPHAPRRVWDAFHGTVINPPEVMVTIRDGYCAGIGAYEAFIKMASTHGGLNQANSATFAMTMTGRLDKPLRGRDVLQALEPGYVPPLQGGR